jgi:hypothetical protein
VVDRRKKMTRLIMFSSSVQKAKGRRLPGLWVHATWPPRVAW